MSSRKENASKENFEKNNHSNNSKEIPSTSIKKTEIKIYEGPFSKDNPNLKVASSLVIGENWYLCSEKLIQFEQEEKELLKKHSLKTFEDLHKELENYKIKTNAGNSELLSKPTVVGLHKNVKKMVYKCIRQIKKIEEKIKYYSDLKEKSSSTEDKMKFIEKLKVYMIYKREIEEILKNEKNIANMKHKNCVKINWFGDFINHFVYLSDYCANKDLDNFLRCISTHQIIKVHQDLKILPWLSFMSENLIKFFVIQILSAIEFFKNIRIVHGNLTLDNILLTADFQVKVTDFASSRFYYSNDTFNLIKYENEINCEFQPPEYFRPDKFVDIKDAHKIDIFSLGCGIFKMATNKSLFEGILKLKNENECLRYQSEQIKNIPKILDEINPKRSQDFVKLLQRMLEIFEKGRITLDELVNTDWVKKNQISLNNLEKINSNDQSKFITEMMKADYIPYSKLENKQEESKFKNSEFFHYKLENECGNLNKINHNIYTRVKSNSTRKIIKIKLNK